MPRFAPIRLDVVPLAHYRQTFDREVRAAAKSFRAQAVAVMPGSLGSIVARPPAAAPHHRRLLPFWLGCGFVDQAPADIYATAPVPASNPRGQPSNLNRTFGSNFRFHCYGTPLYSAHASSMMTPC
jgi:hypothetical protein